MMGRLNHDQGQLYYESHGATFRSTGWRGSTVTDLQDFSRRLFAATDQLCTNSGLRSQRYAQPSPALPRPRYQVFDTRWFHFHKIYVHC
jgi:hypothetical protein